MNQKIQSLIDEYVFQHSGSRWMDCGELEVLLTEFAGKIEGFQNQFYNDVKEMRNKQAAYFKERKLHGYTTLASQFLAESRKLEKKVDNELSEEPMLFT